MVIAATVIKRPAPAPKRPRINIHIRVNHRALLDGGSCRLCWGFVDGTDQSVENRVTGSGILELDDLVSGQRITAAGVLNLVHNHRIADMCLHHGFHLRYRRSRRRCADRRRARDAPGQKEARQSQRYFIFMAKLTGVWLLKQTPTVATGIPNAGSLAGGDFFAAATQGVRH